jgi:two-component system, NarL family, nitrate/nitrite response regulator NarL
MLVFLGEMEMTSMADPVKKIRVAILEDHQSIIDGYKYRLNLMPAIEVVGVAGFGTELEVLLKDVVADVLFLDVQVKTAPDNATLYPIFHILPKLGQLYPDMSILIISMIDHRTMIEALMKAGARGYIIKDETAVIERLGEVVVSVANGNNYVSQRVYDLLNYTQTARDKPALTPRQLEALSLCAAHPNWSRVELASALVVEPPTARNLLSSAYFRLGVNTLSAALQKASELGLIGKNSNSGQ